MNNQNRAARNREYRTKSDGQKNYIHVRLMLPRDLVRKLDLAEERALDPEEIVRLGLRQAGIE
jgi:hypothetical protein